jgi:hypothetical protein
MHGAMGGGCNKLLTRWAGKSDFCELLFSPLSIEKFFPLLLDFVDQGEQSSHCEQGASQGGRSS